MTDDAAPTDPLVASMGSGEPKRFAGLTIDVGSAGSGRIQRIIYPAGWRWSVDAKELVGTEWCLHGHVGFLAQGRLGGVYADGEAFSHAAPAFVTLDPGHDLWVEGDGAAVFIQFDFEKATVEQLSLRPRSSAAT